MAQIKQQKSDLGLAAQKYQRSVILIIVLAYSSYSSIAAVALAITSPFRQEHTDKFAHFSVFSRLCQVIFTEGSHQEKAAEPFNFSNVFTNFQKCEQKVFQMSEKN